MHKAGNVFLQCKLCACQSQKQSYKDTENLTIITTAKRKKNVPDNLQLKKIKEKVWNLNQLNFNYHLI